MRRGILIWFITILIIVSSSSVFSLSSIGSEYNLTTETMVESAKQSAHCLIFPNIEQQIQCRLAATQLTPTQSVFCAETVEAKWCQQLIIDAQECFTFNGTEKDACFITNAQSYSVLEYSESDSYILFLILDLIQDVEDRYKNDKLTIRESSFLIEKLINIAQAKMRHEPQFLISTLYSEYRTYWESYTIEPVI